MILMCSYLYIVSRIFFLGCYLFSSCVHLFSSCVHPLCICCASSVHILSICCWDRVEIVLRSCCWFLAIYWFISVLVIGSVADVFFTLFVCQDFCIDSNLCWSFIRAYHCILLCWSRVDIISLCWSHLAVLISCWSRCVDLAVLISLCWSRCVVSCWWHLAVLIDAYCWCFTMYFCGPPFACADSLCAIGVEFFAKIVPKVGDMPCCKGWVPNRNGVGLFARKVPRYSVSNDVYSFHHWSSVSWYLMLSECIYFHLFAMLWKIRRVKCLVYQSVSVLRINTLLFL